MASKIPAMGDQYKSYMPAKNDLSMFVTPVSEPEMKKLIMQLNDGAPGRDGVTAKSIHHACAGGDTRISTAPIFSRYFTIFMHHTRLIFVYALDYTPRT